MTHFICTTCGTQFAASETPPDSCPICSDPRQYVGAGGQRWTTLDALQAAQHNVIKLVEPNLTGVGTHPEFAIGQRALLLQTPGGNILWDCVTLIDRPTIAALNDLGGVSAIAISHPHFYSSMVEYADAFDAPVYLHAADRAHVMRPNPRLLFWEGETRQLWDESPYPRRGPLCRQYGTALACGRERAVASFSPATPSPSSPTAAMSVSSTATPT